jgi:tripartite-type tricarboxylate transporter receptor subunit TctC
MSQSIFLGIRSHPKTIKKNREFPRYQGWRSVAISPKRQKRRVIGLLEGAMMILTRRALLMHLAAGAAALPTVSRVALAQGYPARPVHWVVGYPAGSGADVLARLVGQWLSERLGRPFVIENRPGASNIVATDAVVRAPADGYTLLHVTGANAIAGALYHKLNFNFIRDIAPVAGLSRQPPVMLVHPSFPARSVSEFIAYAKANPGRINVALGGIGGANHLSSEMFKMMTGVNMVHVPYSGDTPALTALLGDQVQVVFASIGGAIEHIKAGKLRALAVTTANRFEALPDIPTMGEFLAGFEMSGWQGVGAPSGTPAEIIDKLNKEINTALAEPEIKSRLADLGSTVLSGTPADFGDLIAAETEKAAKVVKFAGIKPA